MELEHRPSPYEASSLARGQETEQFLIYLRSRYSSSQIDEMIGRHYVVQAQRVDCTACGRCCREAKPTLKRIDGQRLAIFHGLKEREFSDKFLTLDESGDQVFKRKPCPFLSGNVCSCYDARPDVCRSFPHLEKPKVVQRFNAVLRNYQLCPIVFNVIEALKDEEMTNFIEAIA